MPTPFGKYQLQRKLAEGGMAEVFLAKQAGVEGFEKLVVIKRILPQLLKEQDFVRMFINEARLAARLNHPNIVQIFDLGKIDDLYFIAMEFVHGEDIRSLVVECNAAATRPPAGIICRVLADTLAGLHYAHTRVGPDGKPLGLVHRDVSPQNVLATYEGSVKLVDFGIAKATRATSEQTQAGLFKGKFSYMAPEQTRGQPIDARADVFAVGILLWELLTWRRLFKKGTEMATLIAVSEEPVAPPKQIRPELPEELDRIVMRALARPLSDRYPTAQDMRADLEALIRAQGWEADALSVERFMRETFHAKLKAQEADVRAAGLASLDDFLLTIDEGTKATWLREAHQRTPSGGLPTPVADMETLDAQPVIGPSDVPSGARVEPPLPGMRAVVGGGAASRSGITAVDGPSAISQVRANVAAAPRRSSSPSNPKVVLPPPNIAPTAPPTPPPTPPRRSSSPSNPKVVLPPPSLAPPGNPRASSPGAASPLSAQVISSKAAPAEEDAPATIVSSDLGRMVQDPEPVTPMSSPPPPGFGSAPAPPPPVAPAWSASAPTDPGQTSRRQSYDPGAPPSRLRRILVISIAAALVAGLALTVILWPSTPPAPVVAPLLPEPPSPAPTPDPTPSPSSPLATLDINLDKEGVIAVDGTAEPLGRHATVQVQPGVIHKITVQRPGHSPHKFHIAAPAAGEHMPVNLKVP